MAAQREADRAADELRALRETRDQAQRRLAAAEASRDSLEHAPAGTAETPGR